MLKFAPDVLLHMGDPVVPELYLDIVSGGDPMSRRLLPALINSVPPPSRSRTNTTGGGLFETTEHKHELLDLARKIGVPGPKSVTLGPIWQLNKSLCDTEGPGKHVGWPFMLKADAHAGMGVC